ncbi:MAG: hypothetical protein H5U05_11680 [Candidatus Aminicenantes bacterium]|nr:hypothetical protein [Candidatus Aminicenantes bacterium]
MWKSRVLNPRPETKETGSGSVKNRDSTLNASKRRLDKGVHLIMIVLTENGAWDGHPLWITAYKEDLWNALKAAFESQNVVVNEDEWSIGFPWPISSEMSSEDIADRAGAMGKPIARAFEMTYPS